MARNNDGPKYQPTRWVLYRENPFVVLCSRGVGFQPPLRDKPMRPWFFASEADAIRVRKYLRADAPGGLTFVAKFSLLRERIGPCTKT